MTRLALPTPRLDHALAMLGALLVALAAWPWLPQGPAAQAPAAAAQNPLPGAALDLPPLASFAAIADRPLFTPSRRPNAAVKGLASAAFVARYRLLGLVTTGERRIALLADGSRIVEMKEGDALEGWSIKRIEPDRLVLSSAVGEAVLTLRQAAAAAPAATNASNPGAH
jgi:general secretion pathway protein N